jgi:hypothetical protein
MPSGVTIKHLYYFAVEQPSEADRWEMLVGEDQWKKVSTYLASRATTHIRNAPSGLPLIVRKVA